MPSLTTLRRTPDIRCRGLWISGETTHQPRGESLLRTERIFDSNAPCRKQLFERLGARFSQSGSVPGRFRQIVFFAQRLPDAAWRHTSVQRIRRGLSDSRKHEVVENPIGTGTKMIVDCAQKLATPHRALRANRRSTSANGQLRLDLGHELVGHDIREGVLDTLKNREAIANAPHHV